MDTDLTADFLKEIIEYLPETGLFYWREKRGRKQQTMPAGYKNAYGYIVIGINGKRIGAHRFAWLYMHRSHASENIDHVNGKLDDNRIENLRSCSHAQNQKNMKRHHDCQSGFKGVYSATDGRTWFSQIFSDGHSYYLGSFTTKEQAATAYDQAALRLHGDYAQINEVI